MKTINLETSKAWFLIEVLDEKNQALKERNSRMSVDIEYQIRLEKLLNEIKTQVDQ